MKGFSTSQARARSQITHKPLSLSAPPHTYLTNYLGHLTNLTNSGFLPDLTYPYPGGFQRTHEHSTCLRAWASKRVPRGRPTKEPAPHLRAHGARLACNGMRACRRKPTPAGTAAWPRPVYNCCCCCYYARMHACTHACRYLWACMHASAAGGGALGGTCPSPLITPERLRRRSRCSTQRTTPAAPRTPPSST